MESRPNRILQLQFDIGDYSVESKKVTALTPELAAKIRSLRNADKHWEDIDKTGSGDKKEATQNLQMAWKELLEMVPDAQVSIKNANESA